MHSKTSNGLASRTAIWVAMAATLRLTAAHGQVQPQDDNVVRLDDVIVTATKRPDEVRDLPQSISVLTEQQLERQHVTRLTDTNGYLPSVRVEDNGSPGQTSVSVRGIPTVGAGALIGTYIGDTPLGSSANFMRAGQYVLDLLPYDIARIEVLRGPQGTLYGGNTMGGLLKYVLNEPDLDHVGWRFGGGLSTLRGASGSGWDGRLSVNVPLVKDQLGMRASLYDYSTPGWIHNSYLHQTGTNSTRQDGGSFAALWRPRDDVQVKFSLLHQHIDARDNDAIVLDPVTRRPLDGGNTSTKYFFEPFRSTTDYLSATLDWDLRWADFVYATSYSRDSTHAFSDLTPVNGPALPTPGLSTFALDLGMDKWTHEMRLTSKPGGALQWLVGAFYTDEKSHNHQLIRALTPSGAPYPEFDPLTLAQLPATYREVALFGDVTYHLFGPLDVSAGVRTARNEQTFSQVIEAGVLTPPGTHSGRSAENVFTYEFGPRMRLGTDTILYARVASGYRPGGPNIVLPEAPPSVKSDTLINYELGLKSLFWQHRAALDFAFYEIDWKDIQTRAFSPQGLGYFINANGARSRGAEIAFDYLVTDHLQLGFNASYSDSRFDSDFAAARVKAGDPLPSIPRWTGSLVADYYFKLPHDWTGHAGAAYGWSGARNSAVVSSPFNERLGSYGLLGLNADFTKDRWTVRFYGKNVADNRTYLSLVPVQNGATGAVVELLANQPQPREFGVELDVRL